MESLTTYEMWYGRNEPPPEIVKLRAGGVDLEFQDGDLRYLRFGSRELIRHIYSAVRDVNWNTIPGQQSNLSVDMSADRFQIQFDMHHQSESLAFRWRASIEGRADGTVAYAMHGTAERDFRYCRIGFCILHPIEGIAGAAYRATTPDGEVTGFLPKVIEPQWMVDGLETSIFPSFSKLVVEASDSIQLITEFEGDLFETEDQRNWTDGSFKTYCTPISLGYPHQAQAGQEFYQKVLVRVESPVPPDAQGEDQPVQLTLGDATTVALPRLGFGMPSHHAEITDRETDLIADLHPAHIKAEIHLATPEWSVALDRALQQIGALDCALELALFLTDDSAGALKTLQERLSGVPVARIVVFHEDEAPIGTTSSRWLDLAREHLATALPGTLFAGGTNGNFAELNRQRPDVSSMDGVAYTINPQVHLPDERNVIEAIQAQHNTVVTARSFSDSLPISVSSVTLKPPFNQAATEEEAGPAPGELPPEVDRRQMSLFAAGWTIGSLRALSSGGAATITYYETTGWRGLIETANGSPLPGQFRSFPEMVFPVYWVFAFLAMTEGGNFRELICSDSLLVEGLALTNDLGLSILVSNLQPRHQEIVASGLPDGPLIMHRLNEATMLLAATDPAKFVQQTEQVSIQNGMLRHDLLPYETAFFQRKFV